MNTYKRCQSIQIANAVMQNNNIPNRGRKEAVEIGQDVENWTKEILGNTVDIEEFSKQDHQENRTTDRESSNYEANQETATEKEPQQYAQPRRELTRILWRKRSYLYEK